MSQGLREDIGIPSIFASAYKKKNYLLFIKLLNVYLNIEFQFLKAGKTSCNN